LQISKAVVSKTSTGPVEPIIVRGCHWTSDIWCHRSHLQLNSALQPLKELKIFL